MLQIHQGIFTKLEILEIWNKRVSPGAVCEMTLKQLLLFSPLKRLLFRHVDTLTDGLLLNALDQNRGLARLGNIVFDHCKNLGPQSLMNLLEHRNSLSVLRVWECERITNSNRDWLKKEIQEQNLVVYFEWFPYNAVVEAMQDVELDDSEEDEEDQNIDIQ